jgi:FkbM family methyltransferase
MRLLSLLQPEYLYRPSQILRRLRFKASSEPTVLPLPWNCGIKAVPAETIGMAIATQGIYDLSVTESLMRLTESGDLCLDIGGNIGFMSLVLALSAGKAGKVMCFEPNPGVHSLLRDNLRAWANLNAAPINLNSIALSDQNGLANLAFPSDYSENQGVASLVHGSGGVSVETATLDSLSLPAIGVVKVDVEGHEAAVFRGARAMLKAHAIRDIVFEEHDEFPAGSHRELQEQGYSIFRLGRSLRGPVLERPDSPKYDFNRPQNFLATVNPARAEKLFSDRTWKALAS